MHKDNIYEYNRDTNFNTQFHRTRTKKKMKIGEKIRWRQLNNIYIHILCKFGYDACLKFTWYSYYCSRPLAIMTAKGLNFLICIHNSEMSAKIFSFSSVHGDFFFVGKIDFFPFSSSQYRKSYEDFQHNL